jgi:DNA mismatch endonuclease (patch repair protein)
MVRKGMHLSEEHKRKLAEAKKRNWQNLEYRKMMMEARRKKGMYNKRWREKIRERTIEAMQDPEVKKKCVAPHIGKSLSEEQRRKIGETERETMKKLWQDPEFRKYMNERTWQNPEFIKKIRMFRDTKPERMLEGMLKRLNIQYEKQKPIFGIPDFFIMPNYCIFVDGDYWHNYPDGTERDREVNEKLTEQGYIVLRFWEHEIYEKPEKIENVLKNIKLKFVRSKPIEVV